ncbi:MAG: hypothetical protein AAGC61_02905 [Microbacterium sp.]
MSDAEAAIQAANITLWGAIIVGTLAMVGTLVSSVIAPGLRARAEAHERRENARLDALRTIIPEMVTIALKNRFRASDSPAEIGELLACIVRFELWLDPNEAVIGRIVRNGLVMAHPSSVSSQENEQATTAFTSATGLLPRWVRGQLAPDDFLKQYNKETGRDLS